MNTNTDLQTRPRVALLGTGTMGAGIARRLLDEGFTVDVWNRTPGPAAELASHGATKHSTPVQAVAGADVVLTMLPHQMAVNQVMLGGGTLDALRNGATWVQMGTIGVEATEAMAAEVGRRRPDVAFVDAPVSGSRQPARTGGLILLASGPDEAQTAVAPVFAAIAQRTIWLGPAGAGSRMKVVVNTLLAFEIEAVAETRALAARLGIDYAQLIGAIGGGPLASAFEMNKLAKMESGDDSADFSLQWALKDLDLVLAAAGPKAAPITAAIAERWRQLVDLGYGGLDVSAARLGLDNRPPDQDNKSNGPAQPVATGSR
jgi:3-hydroxyisobutyrate dehydrogenase